MKAGFVLLCLVGSGVALACGGSVLSADDEGGTPPDTAPGATGTARLPYCGALVKAARTYSECTDQDPPDAFYGDLADTCERIAGDRPRCTAPFEALTRCQADALAGCSPAHDACEPEEREYLDCVSGGSCAGLGGGTISEHTPREIFTTHEACECVEDANVRRSGHVAVPPGGACEHADECAFVCCPCSPGGEYSAAICDKSASGGHGPGRCASAAEACAATTWRCDADVVTSKNRL